MNFTCIICSDTLQPNLEIHATACGHIFHHICLVQWLERSKTCPQCRCKVTERTIHRLFFNVANTDGIPDDVGTLQSKIDSMQFQMRLKDKDVQNYKEKYHKAKDQSTALRTEVRTLESKQTTFESVIHALKEQVSFFKLRSKDIERLNDEVKRLKNKLQNLENVETVISGTREQVREMLRYNKDPDSLNLLICTLKKELVESERKYRHQNMTLKHLQNDINMMRKQMDELKKTNNDLKYSAESHKNCETEKQCYKKRLSDLEERISNRTSFTNSPSSSLECITLDTPPRPKESQNVHSSNNVGEESSTSSPKDNSTKDCKASDAFSLSIKSSNVGLSCLLSPKVVIPVPKGPQRNPSEYNIFKTPHASYTNFKVAKPDYSYDGLGGHCKDTKFPVPKPIAGVKRHQPLSSSASKLRKLAPNKKVTDYLNKNADDVTLIVDE